MKIVVALIFAFSCGHCLSMDNVESDKIRGQSVASFNYLTKEIEIFIPRNYPHHIDSWRGDVDKWPSGKMSVEDLLRLAHRHLLNGVCYLKDLERFRWVKVEIVEILLPKSGACFVFHFAAIESHQISVGILANGEILPMRIVNEKSPRLLNSFFVPEVLGHVKKIKNSEI